MSYRCDIFLSSPSSNVDRSVKDSCSELSASHCRLKIIASPCQMSTLCNVGDTKSLTVGEHLPCLLGRRLAIMEVSGWWSLHMDGLYSDGHILEKSFIQLDQ